MREWLDAIQAAGLFCCSNHNVYAIIDLVPTLETSLSNIFLGGFFFWILFPIPSLELKKKSSLVPSFLDHPLSLKR